MKLTFSNKSLDRMLLFAILIQQQERQKTWYENPFKLWCWKSILHIKSHVLGACSCIMCHILTSIRRIWVYANCSWNGKNQRTNLVLVKRVCFCLLLLLHFFFCAIVSDVLVYIILHFTLVFADIVILRQLISFYANAKHKLGLVILRDAVVLKVKHDACWCNMNNTIEFWEIQLKVLKFQKSIKPKIKKMQLLIIN